MAKIAKAAKEWKKNGGMNENSFPFAIDAL